MELLENTSRRSGLKTLISKKLFWFLKRATDGSDTAASESPLLDFVRFFYDFVGKKELETL